MKRALFWGLAALSGACIAAEPPSPLQPGQIAADSGASVYRQTCQACHMADGRGAEGGGSYPALAGNPRLASADFAIMTVVSGRRNMPAFAPRPDFRSYYTPAWLSDEQIAQVVNAIRTGFGNDFPDAVTVDQVARMRQALQSAPAPEGADPGTGNPASSKE